MLTAHISSAKLQLQKRSTPQVKQRFKFPLQTSAAAPAIASLSLSHTHTHTHTPTHTPPLRKYMYDPSEHSTIYDITPRKQMASNAGQGHSLKFKLVLHSYQLISFSHST